MPRVLLTAFEPFGPWTSNSSWLALQQITSELPPSPQLTTRRYPVDYPQLRDRLERDLSENYDAAIFLGQASGRTVIELEAIGLNLACDAEATLGEARTLCEDGPVAYRSELPLGEWAQGLRAAGVPAQASYHAGTYLCNAALYTAHYLIERMALGTRAAFVHLPLDVSQVVGLPKPPASLPVEVSAAAVRWILARLAEPAIV